MNGIDRRDFLSLLSLSAASAALPGWDAEQSTSDHPNIVFVLADDLGYGDLNCQNPESKIPTPHMDQLAQEGVRFTDAHSPSSVCSPTRYGLLTGRYAWRTHLKKSVLWAWDPPLIDPDRLTVGKLLKRHGYHTACIGKWHLGWDWPTTDEKLPRKGSAAENVDFSQRIGDGPITRGFDYYFGDDVPNFPPYCFIENDRTVGIPSLQKPAAMFGHAGPMVPGWTLERVMPELTARAVGYIDTRAKAKPEQPFFLYLALTAPHTPIVPAQPFLGKSRAGRYGDYVHQVDRTVGQVMEALKRNHVEEKTLLIVTSDNGSPARDGTKGVGAVGSVTEYGHDPSWILRGIKSDTWDGGHRVPFLARWPGHTRAGTTCDELVSLIDFMATAAAVAGAKLPDTAGEDSYNILPALLGEERGRPIREALVHHSGGGMFAIRQGPWKLILGRGSGGFSKPSVIKPKPGEPIGQLYHLGEDLSEERNRYQDRPEVVTRLSSLLEQYKNEGRSAPR